LPPRFAEALDLLMLNALAIAVGIVVILSTLNDAFQTVVVPRATGRRFRISFYYWRAMWHLWPKAAWRFFAVDGDRREDFLALFAPLMLVSMLAMWVGLLIFGFAFVLWGMRGGITPAHQTFGTMLYFAGTSLLTIGFGDVVGRSGATRLVSLLAGLAGLSFLSIMTAFIFATFGSFQQRERFVVTVAARAGAPPSGVNLLAIAGYSLTSEDLPELMREAQDWAAAVMESHLAYPMLAYFRSSHDDQSWVGTLGTLLDAATVLMTTVDGVRDGQARIFYNVGRHATVDLSRYFRLDNSEASAGIEREEFEHACDRLVAAGFKLYDRDEAWRRFSSMRSTYATALSAMASFFEIPPLQWIGDRSAITVSPHGGFKIRDPRPPGGETA
jgi:hypothetical protein